MVGIHRDIAMVITISNMFLNRYRRVRTHIYGTYVRRAYNFVRLLLFTCTCVSIATRQAGPLNIFGEFDRPVAPIALKLVYARTFEKKSNE